MSYTSVETAECFGPTAARLRGMLHLPVAARPSGLVICPPFGEERKSAARVMTRVARALCAAGVSVLRFDYRGTGESDGEFADCRVSHWLEDIVEARRHLAGRSGTTRVSLLGIRFGAALAAMASAADAPPPLLVLWLAVMSGSACLEEVIRRMAATRLVCHGSGDMQDGGAACDHGLDLGAFCVSPELRADLESLDVNRDARSCAECVFSMQFERRAAGNGGHEETCRRLTRPGGTTRVVQVPGRPFWVTASRFDPQALIAVTLEQFRSCGLLDADRTGRAAS